MRRASLFLAFVLLGGGCGTQRPKLVDTPPPTTTTFAGSRLTPPRPAPPLSLKDASGRRYTLNKRHGHFVLVTFLYTHCPDVCPLVASSLNTVLRTIGPKAGVEVAALSVDPKGDTARSVRAYAKRMHLLPTFHYLIGSRAELEPAWAAWNVRRRAVPPSRSPARLIGTTPQRGLASSPRIGAARTSSCTLRRWNARESRA